MIIHDLPDDFGKKIRELAVGNLMAPVGAHMLGPNASHFRMRIHILDKPVKDRFKDLRVAIEKKKIFSMNVHDAEIIRLAETIVPACFNKPDFRKLFSNYRSDTVLGTIIDQKDLV